MLRLLLLSLVFFVVFRLMNRVFGGLFGPNKPGPDRMVKNPEAHEMVACGLCGTFISPQEGEMRKGRWICKPRCPDTGPVGVG